MTDPKPAQPSTFHAPASAAEAQQHSDEHWARLERAGQQQATMVRLRWWTIAAVVVVGAGAWLVFMR